jgi:hypothetical protein
MIRVGTDCACDKLLTSNPLDYHLLVTLGQFTNK